MRTCLLLCVLIFSSSESDVPDGLTEVEFQEFRGGYGNKMEMSIKLYKDSTYVSYEWFHHSGSLNDVGKWTEENRKLLLNSSVKTRWIGRRKSKKAFHFVNQEFVIDSNVFTLVPNDTSDAEFYNAYFRLFLYEGKM